MHQPVDRAREMEQRKRLIQWTENVIRLWNWPLVLSGDIRPEDLDAEIRERSDLLSHMSTDTMTASVLIGLPDELFYDA